MHSWYINHKLKKKKKNAVTYYYVSPHEQTLKQRFDYKFEECKNYYNINTFTTYTHSRYMYTHSFIYMSTHVYALTQMQEPFYYVLDNNNAPCKDVPCSAGTSDISPKEELSCADCDLPPVYQDITELPSKANTEIGHKDELERRNNEDDHLLSNPNSPQENKL